MNFKTAPTLPEGMFDTALPNPFTKTTVPSPWCGTTEAFGCCRVCMNRTRFIFVHEDMLPSFVCSEECFDQTGFRGSYVAPLVEASVFVELPSKDVVDEVLEGEDFCCTGNEVEAVGDGLTRPDGILQAS